MRPTVEGEGPAHLRPVPVHCLEGRHHHRRHHFWQGVSPYDGDTRTSSPVCLGCEPKGMLRLHGDNGDGSDETLGGIEPASPLLG